MSAPVRVPAGPRGTWRSLPDEDYAALLAAQGGHCAICPSTPKTRRLHVDHNHKTGAVRGLLCHRCNRNLPNWVTRAWLWNACLYLDDQPLDAGALVLYAQATGGFSRAAMDGGDDAA